MSNHTPAMVPEPPAMNPEPCEHHWGHLRVAGLAICLLISSTFGYPNVEEINRQIRDLRRPVRAWVRRLREHAEVTSWPFAVKFAVRRVRLPLRKRSA